MDVAAQQSNKQSKKRKKTEQNLDHDKLPSKKVKNSKGKNNGQRPLTKSEKRALKKQTEPYIQLNMRCKEYPCVSMSELQELVYYVLLVASRPPTPIKWFKIWNVDMIKKVVIVFVNQVGKSLLGDFQRSLKHSKSFLQKDVKVNFRNHLLSPLDDQFFQAPVQKEIVNEAKDSTGVTKTLLLMTEDDIKSNDFPIPYSLNQTSGIKDIICIPSAVPATDTSPMFAIDCEMCETTKGRELTRISIVDEDLRVVYDTLVVPDNLIVDYKTKYSGITAERLSGCTTRLSDVQEKLLQVLPPDCILLGHSLEFDFRALKFYHRNIIDTSDIFPHQQHKAGYKSSLRYLARVHLKTKIQRGNNGHCSTEDARTCMSLVQLNLKKDCPPLREKVEFENVFKSFEKGIHSVQASVIDKADMAERRCVGCVNAVPCGNDEEVTLKTAEEIQISSFVWSQLRAMETYLKGFGSQQKEEVVIKQIDKNLADIFKSLPQRTLLMVVFGGGNVTGSEVASSSVPKQRIPSMINIGDALCCFHLKN